MKFRLINEKIDEIVEQIAKYESYGERINELLEYKINNEKEMLSHSLKFSEIKIEMKENFDEYEGIIKKYKSKEVNEEIVGDRRKFKTYPELMRYLYQNISQFNAYKEKSNLDFKGYKSKLDSTISSFKNQINSIIDSMKNFTRNNIKESEDRIKGIISLFDERIVEIRSEINKNNTDIKKENENFLNETTTKVKEEIYKKMDIGLLSFNDLLKQTQNKFEENISECNKKFCKIKEEFDKYKLNEEKKFEMVKMMKIHKENILNKQYINNRTYTRRNMAQRDNYKPNQYINNNESQIDKIKKNFVFNSPNTVKETTGETKIKKEEKNIENSNDNMNNKSQETKNIPSIMKKMNNQDINTLFRIKKISQTWKMKNHPELIKDNNNNEEKINKSMKNFNELKNKDLPKIDETKNNESFKKPERAKKSILKIRNDKKNETSSFFFDNNGSRKISKRVSSTINFRKEKIIIKQNFNSQNNIDINIKNEQKSFTKNEPIINQKLNNYDVTFKPYKDYDRNKILKMEESKNSPKNLNENNLSDLFARKISTAKHKKREYSYINSKGEISNIIEMPPPEDAIHKSIFQIEI